MQSRLQNILAHIAAANEAYDTADAPIMTDAEYDALRREADAIHAFARQIKISIFLLALLLSACLISMPTAKATSTVPFVGCASTDGTAAPSGSQVQIILPAAVASKLAIYVGAHLAALAPRGWKCTAAFGTSGSSLHIVPSSNFSNTGPAIDIALWDGGNPGAEYWVTKLGARFFPKFVSKARVDELRSEYAYMQPSHGTTFVPPAHSGDDITYITPEILGFMTPAIYPVFGFVRIFTQGNEAFAIETVAISLPNNQSTLTKRIVAYAKTCLTHFVLNGLAPYCGITATYPED
jgi:hypothetical protein